MKRAVVAAALALPARVHAAPADDVAKVVKAELDAFYSLERDKDMRWFGDDASIYSTVMGGDERGELVGMWMVMRHDSTARQIALARDGKTAWVSFVEKVQLAGPMPGMGDIDAEWHISEVLASTKDGWRIVATDWTEPLSNAATEKLSLADEAPDPGDFDAGGDASLRAAFDTLVTTGFAKPDAVRKDLVVFGSAPGERTTSGPAFAHAWNAAWVKKLQIVGNVDVKLAPSGTTGWVAANVKQPRTKGKQKYAVPFRVFFVFDKDAAGDWQLVHAQLSTPHRVGR